MTTNLFPLPYWAPAFQRVPLPFPSANGREGHVRTATRDAQQEGRMPVFTALARKLNRRNATASRPAEANSQE
jgi:hypothetical protein